MQIAIKPHGNRQHEAILYRPTRETVKKSMKDMHKMRDVFQNIIINT